MTIMELKAMVESRNPLLFTLLHDQRLSGYALCLVISLKLLSTFIPKKHIET